jgi:hypothetical protein
VPIEPLLQICVRRASLISSHSCDGEWSCERKKSHGKNRSGFQLLSMILIVYKLIHSFINVIFCFFRTSLTPLRLTQTTTAQQSRNGEFVSESNKKDNITKIRMYYIAIMRLFTSVVIESV